jgi:hypothetical protein
MHRLSLLISMLFVAPLLASGSPKECDERSEEAGLEGDWLLVRVQVDG